MIINLKNKDFFVNVDTLGAQLISFYDGEREYIWQREEPYWRKCAPILFPVIGRSKDWVINVRGKDFPMPIHGFASSKEFEMCGKSDNEVVLLLKSDEETLKSYPFEFELYVTISVNDNGVKTEMKVKNNDNEQIFFGIGGHPGIRIPLYEGEDFENYRLEFDKSYNLTAITCDDEAFILPESAYKVELDGNKLPLKRELFLPDAIIIEDVPFDSFKFLNRENKGIEFNFSNFKSFAIWTEALPAKAPFICFEPWNSMGKRKGETTALKDKFGIITLEQGKEFVCSYSINPIR